MTEPLRSVAIVGGGMVGLSAAAALARALPDVSMTLVSIPPDPAALADRMPGTLPTVHRFHAQIGLDSAALVATGIAAPRLGTRFTGWGADEWLTTFGRTGRPLGVAPFHHLWALAHDWPERLPFHRYAPAAVAVEAGRFDPARETRFDWGLNLDPARYAAVLATIVRPAVEVVRGVLDGATVGDSRLHAVHLAGGRSIEADLFVDAAGPAAPLLSRVDDAFERWDAWLPSGRLGIGDEPGAGRPVLVDQAVADAGGWRMRADHSGGAITVGSPARSPETIDHRPGRRPRPWIGNVVAIGDAACAIDPLLAANLSLAHSQIRRLLGLLPDRRFAGRESAEYNRLAAEEEGRLRDILALHHLGRQGRLIEETMPASLALTVQQFARRGRLPFFEGETFAADAWITSLLSLGVDPVLSDRVVGAEQARGARELLRRMATEC